MTESFTSRPELFIVPPEDIPRSELKPNDLATSVASFGPFTLEALNHCYELESERIHEALDYLDEKIEKHLIEGSTFTKPNEVLFADCLIKEAESLRWLRLAIKESGDTKEGICQFMLDHTYKPAYVSGDVVEMVDKDLQSLWPDSETVQFNQLVETSVPAPTDSSDDVEPTHLIGESQRPRYSNKYQSIIGKLGRKERRRRKLGAENHRLINLLMQKMEERTQKKAKETAASTTKAILKQHGFHIGDEEDLAIEDS